MVSEYWMLSGLFLLCLAIRAAYELLKKSGRVNPENKLAFGVVFLAMCALWGSWFSMVLLDPLHLELPAIVRGLGLGLNIMGVVLAVVAVIQLRGMENIDHLVTTGLFSRMRHPMYTGFLMWIVGWPLYHGAAVSILIGLAGIGNILYWRNLEDAHLLRLHGKAYQEYRSRTWL